MQICALLTRIQCKVSDAQVTVKACGPLVSFNTSLVQLLVFLKWLRPVGRRDYLNVNIHRYVHSSMSRK